MIMRAPAVVILLLLGSSSAIAAEPEKQAQQAQEREVHRPIVLASADTRTPVAPDAQRTTTPPKHRPGRVTTCRCGDPQPDPDAQQQ